MQYNIGDERMDIKISFPGNKRVNAEVGGHVIATDQPVSLGGDGTAPSPYAHFLASIGTCAGIYVLSFCQERGIPTERLTLLQRHEYTTSETGVPQLSGIRIEIHVPPDFPEKYLKAVARVAEQCAVKKTIQNPPPITVEAIKG